MQLEKFSITTYYIENLNFTLFKDNKFFRIQLPKNLSSNLAQGLMMG